MRILLLCFSLLSGSLSFAMAQSSGQHAFPKPVLAAKTVAILNDTHVQAVEDGAVEELRQWGHVRVIDDPESADVVLHFMKTTTRSTSNTQKQDSTLGGDKDNDSSYGFSVSSSSSVHMEARARDGLLPFYSTATEDAKAKAGRTCVQKFIGAFQDSVRAGATQ